MTAVANEVRLDAAGVESAALQLPVEARARLAARLIESLEEETRLEDMWKAEVLERIRAVDAGEMGTLSEEECDASVAGFLR